jgi:hypothetical protein
MVSRESYRVPPLELYMMNLNVNHFLVKIDLKKWFKIFLLTSWAIFKKIVTSRVPILGPWIVNNVHAF